MPRIKDCLIIAAGKGTRLKERGDIKPLVKLCETPLIEHAMSSAAKSGVERFVVITGFEAPALSAALKEIALRRSWEIITEFNPDYQKENGLSVLCGKEILQNEFYLTMCDHVVEPEIYERLSGEILTDSCVALGVDYRLLNPDVDIDDVTKVKTDAWRIKNIGKSLTDFDSYDTGVFRANSNLFAAIEESHARNGDCSISGGMKLLAEYKLAVAIDTKEARWIDVDSAEMFDRAEKWLNAERRNQPAGLLTVGSV